MRGRYLFVALLLGAALLVNGDYPSGNLHQGSVGVVITAAATTVVTGVGGVLRRIIVTTSVASATIKLFDLASASCTGTPSTNPKAVLTLPSTVGNPFALDFDQNFANGICVLTSGATNLTVIVN